MASIVLEILFAVIVAFVIEQLKKALNLVHIKFIQKCDEKNEHDTVIFIAMGIFICSMLIGNFEIDGKLRSIIYSCNMVSFVFFLGYFYKHSQSMVRSIKQMFKIFILPYSIFVLCEILIHYEELSVNYFVSTFKQYFLGISSSNKWFSDVASVGPIYFILLLFSVGIIYILIDHTFKNEKSKLCVIIVISVFGFLIGQSGYWLPCSMDIACYVLIIFEIGVLCNKYCIMKKIRENSIFYFLLSSMWVYMIYAGSMEIAIRNYGQYGIMLIGAISGVMIIYMLSTYIEKSLPVFASILGYIGKANIYIIIVNTMLGGIVAEYVLKDLGEQNAIYMIFSIIIQISIAVGVWVLVKHIKDLVIAKVR